ncbi:MAG: hypothetical protein AAGE01_12220 [Pseudomonadota bacterium]
MSAGKDRQRLDSWKAIGNYLDRSVRTVRRWEAEEGLPVHRQMHKSQGRIFAFADELDAWQAERAVGPNERVRIAPSGPAATPPEGPSIGVLPFAFHGSDPANPMS